MVEGKLRRIDEHGQCSEDNSGALASLESQATAFEAREHAMAVRRREAAEHQYKEIWTKDPHGGPYKKALAAKSGYDALENPHGITRPAPELGYDKPQSGPTTNFVGNHMTQGAIDLIQAQLEQEPGDSAPNSSHSLLKQVPEALIYGGPKLIETRVITQHEQSQRSQKIESYMWSDEGPRVRVMVLLSKLPGLNNKDADGLKVDLSAKDTSMQLNVTEAETSRTWSLCIPKLFHLVVSSSSSHCFIRRRGADSDIELQVTLLKVLGHLHWPTLTAEADQPCRSPRAVLPPPDLAALRKMVRMQRQQQQEELLEKLSITDKDITQAQGDSIACTSPSIASATVIKPSDAEMLLKVGDADSGIDEEDGYKEEMLHQTPVHSSRGIEENLKEAVDAQNLGDYARAAELYGKAAHGLKTSSADLSGDDGLRTTAASNASLSNDSSVGPSPSMPHRASPDCTMLPLMSMAVIYTRLGECLQNIGRLNAASEAFASAALASGDDDPCGRSQALVSKGIVLEQMEKLKDAANAFIEALRADSSCLAASQGVARCNKKGPRMAEHGGRAMSNAQASSGGLGHYESQHSDDGPPHQSASQLLPSVPRPCLKAFRNRGKSGKPF